VAAGHPHQLYISYLVSLSIGSDSSQRMHGSFSLPCANIVNGKYRYLSDLLAMEASSTPTVVQNWPVQHSPIRIDRLTPFLATHPDQDFATFIHRGLTQGFRIGYQARTDGLKASHKNHPSSLAAAAVVDERISTELLAGRLLGPLPRNLEALVGCADKVAQLPLTNYLSSIS